MDLCKSCVGHSGLFTLCTAVIQYTVADKIKFTFVHKLTAVYVFIIIEPEELFKNTPDRDVSNNYHMHVL